MPSRGVFAGYRMQLGGEKAKQEDGFANLAKVLIISMLGIYAAVLRQFNNAVKPLLVFAATPYGVVGALLALAIMGSPFGFMAFLGIASLIGVIVSHVIVLFDFIEEMHEAGGPFEQALRDAGIERLRPAINHCRRYDPGPVSSRQPRRAPEEAALLCPDRRLDRSDVHHLATRSILLQHRGARPENRKLGNEP